MLAVLLFIGGYIVTVPPPGAARAPGADQAADEALAQARASDRGWDLDLEAAAREAYASRFDGREPEKLHLIQVVDKPGTEADEAVFRAVVGLRRDESITLGRREDGAWFAVQKS